MATFPQSSRDFVFKYKFSGIGAPFNNPQLLANRDPNRVVLIISVQSGNVYIGPAEMAATTKFWFQISSSNFNLVLTYEDVGPLVFEEFWGGIFGGAAAVGVIEIVYQPGAHPDELVTGGGSV